MLTETKKLPKDIHKMEETEAEPNLTSLILELMHLIYGIVFIILVMLFSNSHSTLIKELGLIFPLK